jgi:hypothetical protein
MRRVMSLVLLTLLTLALAGGVLEAGAPNNTEKKKLPRNDRGDV